MSALTVLSDHARRCEEVETDSIGIDCLRLNLRSFLLRRQRGTETRDIEELIKPLVDAEAIEIERQQIHSDRHTRRAGNRASAPVIPLRRCAARGSAC